MIIATWNVNSLRVRAAHVLKWIETANPQVLCLQETKVPDKDFPRQVFEDAGYQVAYVGQKTFNGVAILSRHPLSDVECTLSGIDQSQKRFCAATVNGVRVLNIYVPNGSEVGSDKYRFKLRWMKALIRYLETQIKLYDQILVAGDFNIAPEDRDVHAPERWQGSVLVSKKERQAFSRLLDLGLVDIFRQFDQPEKSYSWWDYRLQAFQRGWGLRIDHILCSPALAQRCQHCVIDTNPRAWERPSDHAPVLAQFNL